MRNNKEIEGKVVADTVTAAIHLISHDLPLFTDHFKIDGSVDNFYEPKENISWTSGFWTGQLWLAYEFTGDIRFRKAAEKQVESFRYRIQHQLGTDHHDMGFLYSLSCVASYKLTGSQQARDAAVMAARQLISRYQPKGRFIQAWGKVGAVDQNRLIIDCLMNLPLLYWAYEVTREEQFANIARAHIDTSLPVIMRENHSTYHTYYFDPDTGRPLYGETTQGYSNESSWARGQAWGIYGTALSFKYTAKDDYKRSFYAITDYFIERLPRDHVPYWDLDFTEASNEPKDSSAAAIAVCGMLEMAKYLDQDKSAYYTGIANQILASLIDHYRVTDPKASNGLLLHGVYAKKSPFNPCQDNAVDECTIWGDYFYLEALMRVSSDWGLYW
ncbi:MAG: glycoside hydrolase family 88 protein [Lachnospiraceae bacterium]